MKKSKKIILALLLLIIAVIAVVLMNPEWFDSGEKVKIEVSEEVQDTHNELEEEIFD